MAINVIDIIKAKNAGSFPIVEDSDFLGGMRSVADTIARNAIPAGKRKEGMWVYTTSDGTVWTLSGGILDANWIEVTLGNLTETSGNVILNVSTTGSDAPTIDRPAILISGDYSAYPFLTIQSAIDSLPKNLNHAVIINISAGTYVGCDIYGFNTTKNSHRTHGGDGYLQIIGVQGLYTTLSGPNQGTATAGTDRTLTLTGAGWTVDDLAGHYVNFISGTGAGQWVKIAANTTDTITFAGLLVTPPSSDSIFDVTEEKVSITHYNTGCIGLISNSGFAIEISDVKLSASSYGIAALETSGISINRCSSSGGFIGFYAYKCLVVNWNQISAINSTAIGVFVSHSLSAADADKGWFVSGCPTGIQIDSCNGNALTGVYIKNATTSSFVLTRCSFTLSRLLSDGGGYGINIYDGHLYIQHGTTDISNSTISPFILEFATLEIREDLTGTGNSGWGMNADGRDNFVALITTPTITGVLGEVTVDGINDITWSNLDLSGNSAQYLGTNSHIAHK